MRAYHKSWQSDRPMKRDTRRVKWYEGPAGDGRSIRLVFEDGEGRINLYYTDRETATRDYEAFIAGTSRRDITQAYDARRTTA